MMGGGSALVPSADEDQINELQRISTQCGVSWEEILAYMTVVYENDFEDVDIESVVAQFLIVRYEQYSVEIVETERQVEDPVTGEMKTVTYTTLERTLESSGILESEVAIRAFALLVGTAYGDIVQIVDHLRVLDMTEEFDIQISSKDMLDFYESFDGEQKEWYNALISENIIQQEFGTYYELPEEIIVETAGYFAWPVPGIYQITSPFGWREDPVYGGRGFHQGIDIAQSGCQGTPVIAAADGTVVEVQYKTTGYGLNVTVAHVDADGNTWQTKYAHLNQISVERGQQVNRGTVVGAIGSTGKSTGPHLHFEIMYQGSRVDPALFF
jgi:murein DD-endopeptidase MepM/ murein hydrolase activator NlpD